MSGGDFLTFKVRVKSKGVRKFTWVWELSNMAPRQIDMHRWTWYSNTGGARNEIDNVLVGDRWRLVQNCRVVRGAMFAGIDHRFLVATLKIRLKSRNMVQSNRLRLDVRRLRDESVAPSYKWKLSANLTILTIMRNSVLQLH